MTAAAKVAVLGAGAWGTALAKVLAEKGMHVDVWARRADLAAQINEEHENRRYLPGFPLPANILPTNDLPAALGGVIGVVIAVPSGAD